MDIGTWSISARLAAIFAGIIFGSVAISSASWVWVRRQIFAYGGSALCGAGVILLGLSIWHSVKFGVTGGGLNLELNAAIENEIKRSVASAVFDNVKTAMSSYNFQTTQKINEESRFEYAIENAIDGIVKSGDFKQMYPNENLDSPKTLISVQYFFSASKNEWFKLEQHIGKPYVKDQDSPPKTPDATAPHAPPSLPQTGNQAR